MMDLNVKRIHSDFLQLIWRHGLSDFLFYYFVLQATCCTGKQNSFFNFLHKHVLMDAMHPHVAHGGCAAAKCSTIGLLSSKNKIVFTLLSS